MYIPSTPPDDPKELKRYLINEFRKIQQSLREPQAISITLDTLNVAPDKPQEGGIYKADGTNWNPGSGAGTYEYKSGAYAKL